MSTGPDPRAVHDIFSRIAPRYDLLNVLLSFGQDLRWRRAAARMVAPLSGERFLDLAAGTGAFSKALRRADPAVRVIAADFCAPILRHMRADLGTRVAADGLRLPFQDGSFDGFVIAFGLRNFSDPGRGLGELRRVLKSGGRGLILDFLKPENSLFGFLYRQYLRWWIPILGGVCSGSFAAYRHLTDTIHGFLTRRQFVALLESSGFEVVRLRELTFGAATAILVKKIS